MVAFPVPLEAVMLTLRSLLEHPLDLFTVPIVEKHERTNSKLHLCASVFQCLQSRKLRIQINDRQRHPTKLVEVRCTKGTRL